MVVVPPLSVRSVITCTSFLPRTRNVTIRLVGMSFPSCVLRPLSPLAVIVLICAGVPAANASRMHAYASGLGTTVVGHPASELTESQTLVPGGIGGVVAAIKPVVAVDLLVLGVACRALFPAHADATTRTTQTGNTIRPIHGRSQIGIRRRASTRPLSVSGLHCIDRTVTRMTPRSAGTLQRAAPAPVWLSVLAVALHFRCDTAAPYQVWWHCRCTDRYRIGAR